MKKKNFVSLNIKVFLLALTVMIISSTVVGTLLYKKSIDIVKQKQETLIKNAFGNITDNLEVNMKNAHSISLFIISDDMIRNALQDYDMSRRKMLEIQNEILSSLTFFSGQNSYIESIHIQGDNGLDIFTGKNYTVLDDQDTKAVRAKKGGSVWKWEKNKDGNMVNLSLLRGIRNREDPKEELGILRIDISSEMLKEQFRDFVRAYPGHIAIWNDDGTEIYSYGERRTKDSVSGTPHEGGLREEWLEVFDKKENTLSYYYHIPDSKWFLESSMQYSALYAENNVIRDLLVIGITVSLLLCMGIVYIFSKSILKPLKLLTKKIGEIADENYKIRLDFHSNDEIGLLSTSFNRMAKQLDELVNEVLRGKLLQKDAQFQALQAQINPHFLYNNLDTAYWMSRLEKAEKTGKIILSLSALYRSAVSTVGKLISVETELRYAKDYIVIQRLRLDEQIQFYIKAEDEALNSTTLRFVLQPLIENSIQHGILPAGEPGIIRVNIYQREEVLCFEVEDSGKESSVQELIKLLEDSGSEEKRGMAIRNIHRRIMLQFGAEYGLSFAETEQGGVRAIVKQPIIPYNKSATAD